MLAVLAIAGLAAWVAFREIQAGAVQNSARVAVLLEERVRRALQATEIILKRNAERLETRTLRWADFREAALSLPDPGSLWQVAADGDLIAASIMSEPPRVNFADSEYFPRHRDGAETWLSAGVKGHLTGKYHWLVSRRITRAGRFGGVVLAAMDMNFLSEILDAVALGEGASISVLREDGHLVMRHPIDDDILGRSVGGITVFDRAFGSGVNSGSFTLVSPLDDVERLYSWRRIGGQGLMLYVGVSKATIWKQWRQQIGAFPLAVLVALIPLVVLFRQGVRAAAHEAALRADLEAAVDARTRDLRLALAEAERANHAKSRFLAAASHDLRQPMQAIRLFIEVLKSGPATGDLAVVRKLDSACGSGESLLNSLLHVSTLDAGIVRVTRAPVPLAVALGEIERTLTPLAQQKGLELVVVPSSTVVETDPVLLHQILFNLIGNAIKYTASGRVLVGCRRVGGRVRVEVWDTGIGIPADRLDEVFEDFVQLGNPSRDRANGLGLGLAIVRRTAHLLGHRLTVRSTVGKGSVFAVEMPLGGA